MTQTEPIATACQANHDLDEAKDGQICSIGDGLTETLSLAAKAVAAAAIWRFRSGEGQDIHVDVRIVIRRFVPFFEREWEIVNDHPDTLGDDPGNPFITKKNKSLATA